MAGAGSQAGACQRQGAKPGPSSFLRKKREGGEQVFQGSVVPQPGHSGAFWRHFRGTAGHLWAIWGGPGQGKAKKYPRKGTGCCTPGGTWCSGITSASHAEGPGFKSQWCLFRASSEARRLGRWEARRLACCPLPPSLIPLKPGIAKNGIAGVRTRDPPHAKRM